MGTEPSNEEFISEPIEPVVGTFDASAMSRGEPGLPDKFTWRGKHYSVLHVIRKWKSSTAERGEMYLRRHWFCVETATGQRMTLYCERQAKNAKKPKARWWLYTMINAAAATD